MTSTTVPSGVLAPSRDYYWRLDYADSQGAYSGWSALAHFTTLSDNHAPSIPSAVAPADGATGVSVTPTLVGSTFSDADTGDTHGNTHWEIWTVPNTTDISKRIWNNYHNWGAGLTSTTVPPGVLAPASDYYWRVDYADNHGAYSGWSTLAHFTTAGNRAPSVPAPVAPADGATGVSVTPTLAGSTFSDPDAGDTHGNTHWEIWTVPNTTDISKRVWNNYHNWGAGLTSTTVPPGALAPASDYYWRVDYADSHGAYSGWSALAHFTTVSDNHAPSIPSPTAPADGATGVGLTPTLVGSAFSDSDAADTQGNTHWEIWTVPDTSDIAQRVWNDYHNWGAGLTATAVPPGVLAPATDYYWRVDYADNHGSYSGWSTLAHFTTAGNRAPGVPTPVTPADGTTEVSRTPTLVGSAFSDPDAADTHGNTHWEIGTVADAGDISNRVWTDYHNWGAGLTSTAVPAGVLEPSATYYWRVDYADDHGAYSGWSTWSRFTTIGNHAPSVPSPVAPADGATAVTLAPTLVGSAFSDPDVGDAHGNTHWEVWTVPNDGDISQRVWNDYYNWGAGLTSTEVPLGVLQPFTDYYWRVDYADDHSAYSGWSRFAHFTTQAKPAEAASKVTAQPRKGVLLITGDDLPNLVRIDDLGMGSYQITGYGRTIINGKPADPVTGMSVAVVNTITKGITVDLKKGDDRLEIGGLDATPVRALGDVSIKMADGDDEVMIANAVLSGKLTIDMGKGASQIGIADVNVAKDASVKALDAIDQGVLEAGADDPAEHAVDIEASTFAGRLTVALGQGDASVKIVDDTTVTKDAAVTTKDGDDGVQIVSTVVGAAEGPLFQGKLAIDTGKGDDRASLEGTTVLRDVSIKTREGQDEVWMGPQDAVGGKVTVDSGAGDDVVAVQKSNVNRGLTIKTADGDDDVGLIDVALGLYDEETEAILVRANLNVNTGNGDDRIGMAGLHATGYVTLNSGNAALAAVGATAESHDDQVGITDLLIAGNLGLTTGNGWDEVGIGQGETLDSLLLGFLEELWGAILLPGSVDVAGKLTVATGNGNDSFMIGGATVGGAVSIDTGGGSDYADVKNLTAKASASFKMGAGDQDRLSLEDTTVTAKPTLDGGAGVEDTFVDAGGNVFPPTMPKGFENIE